MQEEFEEANDTALSADCEEDAGEPSKSEGPMQEEFEEANDTVLSADCRVDPRLINLDIFMAPGCYSSVLQEVEANVAVEATKSVSDTGDAVKPLKSKEARLAELTVPHTRH